MLHESVENCFLQIFLEALPREIDYQTNVIEINGPDAFTTQSWVLGSGESWPLKYWEKGENAGNQHFSFSHNVF